MTDAYKKIMPLVLEIMGEIKNVEKNATVAFGGNSFNATKEEDVIALIRPALMAKGLTMIAVDIPFISIDGKVTTIIVKWHLIHCESGLYIELSSPGQGHDGSDKGSGKSFTYALKVALIKLLMLIQGDDPDKTHSEKNVADDLENKKKELMILIERMRRDKVIDNDKFDELANRIHAATNMKTLEAGEIFIKGME